MFIPPACLASSIVITRICVQWMTTSIQNWRVSTHLFLASSFATNSSTALVATRQTRTAPKLPEDYRLVFGRFRVQVSAIQTENMYWFPLHLNKNASIRVGAVLFSKFYDFNERYGSSLFSQNHALRLCSESPYFSSQLPILFIQHNFNTNLSHIPTCVLTDQPGIVLTF